MSTQSPRRYTVLAAAVVVAALVIGLSIFSSSYLATARTVTNDITTTSTQTTTQLSTTTSVQTQTIVAQNNYTVTSTITTSSIATVTNTIIQNETSTTTETVNNPIPWYGLEYLSADPGCSVSSGSTSYPGPCSSLSDPYVFNCVAAAATPQGCTAQVNITGTTNESYTVKIWYPYNSGQRDQNCYWTQILPGQPIFEQINAYCIPVSSTAFIVSEPILSGYV